MKEFNYPIEKIFNGLTKVDSNKKDSPELSECHNIEPVEGEYKLHEIIVDLNVGTAWGNP